ncbi:MAG: hypothetical protein ACYSWX_03365 [Planctomycetota bacterium]|jgi:hypothetical protein
MNRITLRGGLLPFLLSVCAASCSSPPPLPAGSGLRAADQTPPEGIELYERPNWTAGDELIYQRGERATLSFVVEPVGDGWGLRDASSDRQTVLDANLGLLGERRIDAERFDVEVDPYDPAYSWPLWVGKRWTGEFTMRDTATGEEVMFVARYHCEAGETITVPAGTFETLRIWRRDAIAGQDDLLQHSTVVWYAPEVGYMVRRLSGSLETVLTEHLKQ